MGVKKKTIASPFFIQNLLFKESFKKVGDGENFQTNSNEIKKGFEQKRKVLVTKSFLTQKQTESFIFFDFRCLDLYLIAREITFVYRIDIHNIQ